MAELKPITVLVPGSSGYHNVCDVDVHVPTDTELRKIQEGDILPMDSEYGCVYCGNHNSQIVSQFFTEPGHDETGQPLIVLNATFSNGNPIPKGLGLVTLSFTDTTNNELIFEGTWKNGEHIVNDVPTNVSGTHNHAAFTAYIMTTFFGDQVTASHNGIIVFDKKQFAIDNNYITDMNADASIFIDVVMTVTIDGNDIVSNAGTLGKAFFTSDIRAQWRIDPNEYAAVNNGALISSRVGCFQGTFLGFPSLFLTCTNSAPYPSEVSSDYSSTHTNQVVFDNGLQQFFGGKYSANRDILYPTALEFLVLDYLGNVKAVTNFGHQQLTGNLGDYQDTRVRLIKDINYQPSGVAAIPHALIANGTFEYDATIVNQGADLSTSVTVGGRYAAVFEYNTDDNYTAIAIAELNIRQY